MTASGRRSSHPEKKRDIGATFKLLFRQPATAEENLRCVASRAPAALHNIDCHSAKQVEFFAGHFHFHMQLGAALNVPIFDS
jgi:hypothetical protein